MAKAAKKASTARPRGGEASRKAKRNKARAPRAAGVSWLAKGYPIMSPATLVEDCARAVEWYQKVFGAKQRLRLDMPGGMVAHCELGFGDSVLMMGSPMPPDFPPSTLRAGIYVKNCDVVYEKALAAGATSMQAPADQFYGDRVARIRDPFGNEWSLMTHVREVSVKEMKKAMAAMGAGGGA